MSERTEQQKEEIARQQRIMEKASAALASVRSELDDEEWKEFVFLAHCKHEEIRESEAEVWRDLVSRLDAMARRR